MKMSNKKIAGSGFHHIALRAHNYDKTFEFYTKALGFTPKLSWGEGNSRAAMLDIGDGGCVEIFAGGAENQPDGAFWHLAFKTTDPDGAYEAAVKGGAKSNKVPYDTIINGAEKNQPVRLAFVNGPDGELIEFFCEK
jgi:glyoxylase I family protein